MFKYIHNMHKLKDIQSVLSWPVHVSFFFAPEPSARLGNDFLLTRAFFLFPGSFVARIYPLSLLYLEFVLVMETGVRCASEAQARAGNSGSI